MSIMDLMALKYFTIPLFCPLIDYWILYILIYYVKKRYKVISTYSIVYFTRNKFQ